MKRRAEPYVELRLDTVVHELVEQRSPHDVDTSLPPLARAKAAEAITLLVTDSPTNRVRLGTAPGVLSACVELVNRAWRDASAHDAAVRHLQTDHAFEAAEAAAEALWILSFSSPPVHRTLTTDLNAIGALGSMVTARAALSVSTPPRAAMWAAAALQNLAASYCETADGRCTWAWVQGGTRLAVVPHQRVTVDAEEARRAIASVPSLVEALVGYACEGPVGPHDPPRGTPWPSRARVDSRNAPSVVPWAAAGALKNLALSPDAAHVIMRTPRAAECLCRLARSPDWLESSKAAAALTFLQPRAAAHEGGASFDCRVHDEL